MIQLCKKTAKLTISPNRTLKHYLKNINFSGVAKASILNMDHKSPI